MAPSLDLHLPTRYEECKPGFNWYTCHNAGRSYSGCCSVPACDSLDFCPEGKDQRISATHTIGSMSIIPTSTQESVVTVTQSSGPTTLFVTNAPQPTDTLAASETAAAPINSSPPAQGGNPSRERTAVAVGSGVGALIGLAVLGLIAYVVWGRRRRVNAESALDGGNSSGASDVEKDSGGAASEDSSPPPFIRPPPPARVFDEFGGRHHSPAALDIKDFEASGAVRGSYFSAGDQSTLVSPMTPVSAVADYPQHSELDATPICCELDTSPHIVSLDGRISQADVDVKKAIPPTEHSYVANDKGTHPTPLLTQGPIERPRATLKATDYERRCSTYANSWTKFHQVQV